MDTKNINKLEMYGFWGFVIFVILLSILDFPRFGYSTLILGIGGAAITGLHAWFFNKSSDILSRKMRNAFIGDFLIYVTAALFGIFTINEIRPGVFNYVGVPIGLFAIYHSRKLFRYMLINK